MDPGGRGAAGAAAAGAGAGVALDVYGAGAALYFALTGRPPRPGAPDLFLLESRKVPRPLQAALVRALAERPERRFASAAEFAAALGEAPAPRARPRSREVSSPWPLRAPSVKGPAPADPPPGTRAAAPLRDVSGTGFERWPAGAAAVRRRTWTEPTEVPSCPPLTPRRFAARSRAP